MQNKNNLDGVAVTASAVCKGFGSGETRTEVLKEVNFEARLGELLLLVGPSGCGKTTLLSVIAGTLTVVTVASQLEPRTRAKAASITRFPFQHEEILKQAVVVNRVLECLAN